MLRINKTTSTPRPALPYAYTLSEVCTAVSAWPMLPRFAAYETWFLSEALARNPDIIVYALAWTFPAWVTSAVEGFGSAAVTYIVDWVSMRMRAASGGQLKAVCC